MGYFGVASLVFGFGQPVVASMCCNCRCIGDWGVHMLVAAFRDTVSGSGISASISVSSAATPNCSA